MPYGWDFWLGFCKICEVRGIKDAVFVRQGACSIAIFAKISSTISNFAANL